jgi:hypothetical protein
VWIKCVDDTSSEGRTDQSLECMMNEGRRTVLRVVCFEPSQAKLTLGRDPDLKRKKSNA